MDVASLDLSLDACLTRHRKLGPAASLVVVASADSTNLLARQIAGLYWKEARPVPRTVLVARRQTAGRGRQGRAWESPAGVGLYTSVLLPVEDRTRLRCLPLAVPLALSRALRTVGVKPAIKWPNDLVVSGGKLGGVLIEAVAGGSAVIVGYGINGNQTAADLPVAGATSLRAEVGSPVDLSLLAVVLARAVMDRLGENEPMSSLVGEYRRWSAHKLGDALVCRLGEETLTGEFRGFDGEGRLKLSTLAGDRLVSSAELLGTPGREPEGKPEGRR